jgi:hypothetical protein
MDVYLSTFSDNLANFQTSSDLPVIGFNSELLFQNYAG